jgi:hypothetical protein
MAATAAVAARLGFWGAQPGLPTRIGTVVGLVASAFGWRQHCYSFPVERVLTRVHCVDGLSAAPIIHLLFPVHMRLGGVGAVASDSPVGTLRQVLLGGRDCSGCWSAVL